MTSSDLVFALNWLRDVLVRLDPQRMDLAIDSPVDVVTEECLASLCHPASHAEFNVLIGAFVQRLHAEASRLKGPVAFSEALAEAIVLLNFGQRGSASGYEIALLSVMSGGDAADIIARLAAVTKARERESYANWTLEDAIAPLTWNGRCRLAEGIVVLNRDSIPPDICAWPPAQKGTVIVDLVRLVQETSAKVEAVRPKSIVTDGETGTSFLTLFTQTDVIRTAASSEPTDAFETAET